MKTCTYLCFLLLLCMPYNSKSLALSNATSVGYYDMFDIQNDRAPKINYISSTKQLHIKANHPFDIEEIKLYSILGQKVKEWSNLKPDTSGTLRVSLSNMSKGTYLVSVKTKTGKYNKRLIIGK